MMKPELLAELRNEIRSAPTSDLPSIRGDLAALEAELLVRLTTPQPSEASGDEAGEDQLVDLDTVAKRLDLSPGYVRKHLDEFGRVRLPGNPPLRFSSKRLNAILKRRGYSN